MTYLLGLVSPFNRKSWWKGDSRGGHCELQWSWSLSAVEQVTTSLRQQLWMGHTAGIPCMAVWKSELCGVDGRSTMGVATTPDLNQQRKENLENEKGGMRPCVRGILQWVSMGGRPWAAADLHSMDSMSKGPYIAAKPKLNIFIFLATIHT